MQTKVGGQDHLTILRMRNWKATKNHVEMKACIACLWFTWYEDRYTAQGPESEASKCSRRNDSFQSNREVNILVSEWCFPMDEMNVRYLKNPTLTNKVIAFHSSTNLFLEKSCSNHLCNSKLILLMKDSVKT